MSSRASAAAWKLFVFALFLSSCGKEPTSNFVWSFSPLQLEVAFSQGLQNIKDDDAEVIRIEALIDDAFDAVLETNEEKLGSMLRHINPNLADERGFTLLMMAAQTSKVNIMQLLLNAWATSTHPWTMVVYNVYIYI